MPQITVINPTITHEWNDEHLRLYAGAASPGTQIRVVSLEWGPASIEGRADDALAAAGIMRRAMEAEEQGAGAVIINCMDDPGLYAAREMVSIPVIGPAEASMHLAAMLSHRFSVITTGTDDTSVVEELILRYGMTQKAASVRTIDIPVLALDSDKEATLNAVVSAAEKAVLQDGAGAIIPGCTLMAELISEIRVRLAARGASVPVLNPPLVALRLAEALISLHLSHSPRTYTRPADKQMRWPGEPVGER
jgi:allantoin racemase